MVMTNRASGVACITKLIDNITYTNTLLYIPSVGLCLQYKYEGKSILNNKTVL